MYATYQDIVDRFGLDAVLVATDGDFDGEPDQIKIDRALVDTADEINSYIGKRYTLPLTQVPTVLTRIAGDIAFYRLSHEVSSTDEKRMRYDDAIKWLDKVAMGKLSLGLETRSAGDGDSEASPVEQEVELDSQPRLFKRRTNNRIL